MTEYLSESRGGSSDRLVELLRREMRAELDEPAPDFAFLPLGQNETLSLQQFAGEPVIVMFWKTNCSGCRMQIPELVKVYEEYADDGLNVVFISPEPEPRIEQFLSENEMGGIVASMSAENLFRPYQFFATPSSFVVDRSGRVREVWIGPKMYDALEEVALPLYS